MGSEMCIRDRAFAVGIKGQAINKRLNWHFSVSQPLQPIDGTLSVSYDDYYGRLVTHHVDLADSRDLKALLQVKFIW